MTKIKVRVSELRKMIIEELELSSFEDVSRLVDIEAVVESLKELITDLRGELLGDAKLISTKLMSIAKEIESYSKSFKSVPDRQVGFKSISDRLFELNDAVEAAGRGSIVNTRKLASDILEQLEAFEEMMHEN